MAYLGRNATPSMLTVDSQSVKNVDCAEQKGFDAGISGIKRHIAVDTQGFPHAITTANVTDRSGAFERCELFGVEKLLVDGGYTGAPFAKEVRHKPTVEVVKRSELHTFKVLPKRWVVERSFAWLDKCRRLWKNCERNLNSSLQFVMLAFLAIILKRL